jgi:hypothetical protein
MNRSTPGRLEELSVLFARCRYGWRDFFYELEQGEGSLLSEDPWGDLDAFLGEVDPQHLESFDRTVLEMTTGDDPKSQAQALNIVATLKRPFDLAPALANEARLRKDLEAHLALLLAIGQRGDARGRPIVDAALKDAHRRHAALIALAQLDPAAAAAPGRAVYQKDRGQIVQTLGRPLAEEEYATYYQMAEGVLQVRGREALQTFVAATAGDDEALKTELARLAQRIEQQAEAAKA